MVEHKNITDALTIKEIFRVLELKISSVKAVSPKQARGPLEPSPLL